jgi:hypothetical protein
VPGLRNDSRFARAQIVKVNGATLGRLVTTHKEARAEHLGLGLVPLAAGVGTHAAR